jgi:diketogulonate reductase-like aldo/keto reductase
VVTNARNGATTKDDIMNDPTRREAIRLVAAGLTTLALSRATRAQSPPTSGPSAMPTRPIPSTGERLPIVGLGTWQTFDVDDAPESRAPLERVLATFLALGGRVIDTSPMYGRAETVVGDLVNHLRARDRCFLATKVWTQGKEQGVAQMVQSFQRLRASPIDLMQVHNLVDVGHHLDTLAGWKKDGRVRYVGLTHYTTRGQQEIMRLLDRNVVDVVQVNYSTAERDAENRLLPMCRDKGVAVLINRPFAGGEVLGALRDRRLPGVAEALGCTSWAQLLLKFVLSHPAVTCAIPATSKLAHLRENMAAGTGAMPDADQRAAIASAAAV